MIRLCDPLSINKHHDCSVLDCGTCADLHERRLGAARLLLPDDLLLGLLTEYLGNVCGTVAALGNTSNEVTSRRSLARAPRATGLAATPQSASNRRVRDEGDSLDRE
jgi:hypothetical protein